MDPEKIKAAIKALQEQDGEAALALLMDMIAGDAPSPDAPPSDAPPPDAVLADEPESADDEPVTEAKALSALLRKLTGKQSAGEAANVIRRMFKRVDQLSARDAALDLSSRRELVSELVKLHVEFPATAWASPDAKEGDKDFRRPVQRLMAEPLDSLRARVELHRAAPRVEIDALPAGHDAPAPVRLSRQQAAELKRRGITPEEFQALKKDAVRRG